MAIGPDLRILPAETWFSWKVLRPMMFSAGAAIARPAEATRAALVKEGMVMERLDGVWCMRWFL